jgi:hypothetical protein
MSFPPRCYYCRRIIWWPFGLVFFRAFWRLHVAHRSCVNSVDPRNIATVDHLERTVAIRSTAGPELCDASVSLTGELQCCGSRSKERSERSDEQSLRACWSWVRLRCSSRWLRSSAWWCSGNLRARHCRTTRPFTLPHTRPSVRNLECGQPRNGGERAFSRVICNY